MEIERSYYGNGKLQCELHKFNNKEHGIQKWWYDNGNIWDIHFCVNGRDHGMLQLYTIDKKRRSIFQKNMNNRHGIKIEFKY